jgi:hypothetical protein
MDYLLTLIYIIDWFFQHSLTFIDINTEISSIIKVLHQPKEMP